MSFRSAASCTVVSHSQKVARRAVGVNHAAGKLIKAQQQAALNAIVQELKANPRKILPCLPLVLGKSLLMEDAKVRDGWLYPQVIRFSDVPKSVWFDLLTKTFTDAKFTLTCWQHVNKADRNALMRIVEFVFCLDKAWKIPRAFLCKAFMIRCLIFRSTRMHGGRRIATVTILPDFTLDVTKTTPWTLLPDKPAYQKPTRTYPSATTFAARYHSESFPL